MAGKATFTAHEWLVLAWAVSDAMEGVGMAEKGFWGGFKQTGAMGKHLRRLRKTTDNQLLSELLGDNAMFDAMLGGDKELGVGLDDRTAYTQALVARVHEAKELIALKAPKDLDAFRDAIMDVARTGAESAKGVNADEWALLDALSEALR